MADDASDSRRTRSSEVRLGLVMYGGVSLAIYIYGVAQEFFDAVRGRGIFNLIKALTDSDIVVDVVSGTSAGGINGILLAYCLTNGLEFSEAASTWRQDGGIAGLLRDPMDPNDREPPSVLRGDSYFLPQLQTTFANLSAKKAPLEPEASEIRELDLFVTSTDAHGQIYTRFDAAGHPIDIKDHRILFQLKHRQDRKQPFDPNWEDPLIRDPQRPDRPLPASPGRVFRALAKLARATSSFPAAFEPVCLRQKPQPHADEDRHLALWGWGPVGLDRDVFLIDGGVLDNKPFTPTIREIFRRLSERAVERKIFYVEPDPERFERLPAVNAPNILQAAWRSVVTIPGYESIADDLRSLTEHNDRVERFTRLVRHYRRSPDATAVDRKSGDFIERWRSWERGENLPKPTPLESKSASVDTPSAYAQTRLVALSERVVQGVLRDDGRDTRLTEQQRKAAGELIQAYDDWKGSGDFTLYNFDVEFRIRRLFHALYACPDPSPEEVYGRSGHWRARLVLNRQTQLLDLIRNAVERLLDEADFGWENTAPFSAEGQVQDSNGREAWRAWAYGLWNEKVFAVLSYLLNVGRGAEALLPDSYGAAWGPEQPDEEPLSEEGLETFHERLMKRVEHAKAALKDGRVSDLRPGSFESVLVRTDAYERRMLDAEAVGGITSLDYDAGNDSDERHSKAPKTLKEEYASFIDLDAVSYLLEAFSGLHERDVIETIRISPLDAQRGFSRRNHDQKVSGDVLFHFGGFFKRSWRSNDILWGRLDGLCQLTETLLTPERVEKVVRNPVARCVLADRLHSDLDVVKLFPHSPQATHEDLRTWLEALTTGAQEKLDAALEPAQFSKMVDLMIAAAQLEILCADRGGVGSVIEDAIAEQAIWNQYRVLPQGSDPSNLPGFDPGAGAFFQRGEGSLDALVTAVAAQELASQALAKITAPSVNVPTGTSPLDTAMGTFFREDYKVGGESIAKDIPQVIMLDTLSQALLVIRNCLVAVFGDRAADIRKGAVYRAISVMLWAFDGTVSLLKTGAKQVFAALVGLGIVSALALWIGIAWWTPIIQPEGHIIARWLLVFIVIPSIVLAAELWLLVGVGRRRRRGTTPSARRVGHQRARMFSRLRWSRIAALAVVPLIVLAAYVGRDAAVCLNKGQCGTVVEENRTASPMLALEFAKSQGDVDHVVGPNGSPKRAAAERLLYADFIFILIYTLLFASVAVTLARSVGLIRRKVLAGAILCIGVAAFFDCWENVRLLSSLNAHWADVGVLRYVRQLFDRLDTLSGVQPEVAWTATRKWGAFFTGLILSSIGFLCRNRAFALLTLVAWPAAGLGLAGLFLGEPAGSAGFELAAIHLGFQLALLLALVFLGMLIFDKGFDGVVGMALGLRVDPIWNKRTPLLFPHRGGRLEVPESTERACRHALEKLRADVLEIDVQVTTDGQFVVWHGPELSNVRIDGVESDPSKRSKQQNDIRAYAWKDLDGKAWVADPRHNGDLSAVRQDNDRKLLRLEELLQQFSTANINLELKSRWFGGRVGAEHLPKLVQLLDAHRNARTILVVCGRRSVLREFRRVASERYPTGLALIEVLTTMARAAFGWLPPGSMSHRALQTSHESWLSPRWLIAMVRAAGGATHVFLTGFPLTRNLDGTDPQRQDCPDEQAVRAILDRGVDGLMTDRPTRVGALIKKWNNR